MLFQCHPKSYHIFRMYVFVFIILIRFVKIGDAMFPFDLHQAHTILLVQPGPKPETRTFSDYESVNECMEGWLWIRLLYEVTLICFFSCNKGLLDLCHVSDI